MPDNKVADPLQTIADLQRELAECQAERDEAFARESAAAEVLGVINASPGDLAPVFDAMLEKAFRLCDGVQGSLWTFDGGRPRLASAQGISAEFVEVLREQWERLGPSEHHPMSRLMRGERVVQILDISASDLYRTRDPTAVAAVELGHVRTLMFVALVKDATPLGAFIIARREVHAFSVKQIALVQNFAAQAVIAMENARLITETREALDQQTATAEVLQVINTSPANLAPVFDAILEKAMALCEAAFGMLWTYDGDCFRMLAHQGLPVALEALMQRPLREPPEGSGLRRLLDGEALVHRADIAAEPLQTTRGNRAALVELGGARTQLEVALRKDDVLLGVIHIYRREVLPFSDKQIALLQNFAAQAVIAMENARLITETREALEQQTATAEVLQVINSSPGDLTPVFDATRRRLMAGAFMSAGDYVHASRRRLAMIAGVEDVLRQVDVLLCASAMDPPSRIDEAKEVERTYPRQARTPFNVTGHPALAMMAGISSSGLPLSVQFVGRNFAEATLFQIAREWERAAGTDKKHPPIDASTRR